MLESLCWGKVQTTQDSLEKWKRGIPWSLLSERFQDAVEMTRELGVQCTWIDSLFIIQDDPEDWEREFCAGWAPSTVTLTLLLRRLLQLTGMVDAPEILTQVQTN